MGSSEVNFTGEIPYSWMLADSIEQRLAYIASHRRLQKALYATLLPIFFTGFLMATITITRKKIRRYSSAVYLYVMLLFDLTLTCSWFVERAIIATDPKMSWPDAMCPFFGVLRFVGRLGCLLITIILGAERIFILVNPRRYQPLATPKTAMLISGICLAVVVALSGVSMEKLLWSAKERMCVHVDEIDKGWRQNLYTTYTMALVFATLIIQSLINLTLGYLLLQKRKKRRIDPIQNSISTARQHTNQLNRINLIVFLMSFNSFLFNIPQNLMQFLFWENFYNGKHLLTSFIIIDSLRFFSILILSMKVLVIGASSPKIRMEFWLALKCSKQDAALRARGIEIDPVKLRQREAVVEAAKRNST